MDNSETSTDMQDLLSEIGNLREEFTTIKREFEKPRVLIGPWLRAVIVLLWVGVLAILIEMAALLFNFWRIETAYRENLKSTSPPKSVQSLKFDTKIKKDIDEISNEQKITNSMLRNLAGEVKELKISIEVKKSITDITSGQKLLTNSVQHLEKELKQLYQNEKGIANILTEQKVLATLVRDLKEELNQLRALYRIEENTSDIINSQKILINSFQNLEEKVHKLTELSQDDTSSKIEEELKNILQSLENRRSGTQYQKIVYR